MKKTNLCKCWAPKLRDWKCKECLTVYHRNWCKENKKRYRERQRVYVKEKTRYCKLCKKNKPIIYFTESETVCNACLNVEKKICSCCNLPRYYNEFYKDTSKWQNWLTSICKICSIKNKWPEKTETWAPTLQVKILKEKQVPEKLWKDICAQYTLTEIQNWTW